MAIRRLSPPTDPREGQWVAEQDLGEDAAAATAYAFRCRKSGNSHQAAWSARRAFEALDRHMSEIDNIDWSVPIRNYENPPWLAYSPIHWCRLSLRVNVETLKNSPISIRKPCTDSLFGFGIARRRMARFSSAPHVGIETCRNKVELKVTRRVPRRHRLRPPLDGPSRQTNAR